MPLQPSVRDAMLAAVPSLRAFAISLSGNVDRADDLVQETLLRAIASINSFQPGTNMSAWLFTILRNLFRSEYRKRRREVEDTDGSYVDSLKSPPEQHSRVEFEEFRVALAEAAARPARGPASRRRVGLLLRGGGRDLRERGGDDQEPGQSCAHAALEAALHRQRRQVRPGPHDACRSDRGRARLIGSSTCWRLLLLSETVCWISPTCGPVKPHGRPFSDFRRRSLTVGPSEILPLRSGIAMILRLALPCAGGKGSPCEKEKGRPL